MDKKEFQITKVKIETKEQLDELYKGSALTFIGVCDTEENIMDIIKWINQYTEVSKSLNVNIIKGITMNKEYGLTNDNAYPNDLTFISFDLKDIKEINKIALPRFAVGGRWFDDIVDNNRVRQNKIDGIDGEEEMY